MCQKNLNKKFQVSLELLKYRNQLKFYQNKLLYIMYIMS